MKIYEAKLTYTLLRESTQTLADNPHQIVRYMDGAFDEDPSVEWLYVVPMNRKNRPKGRIAVTKGIATSALAHPREVFKPAIIAGATAIVIVHNHPSGDPAPSRADILMTRQMREAAKVLQIDLLDHIIIGDASDDPLGLGYRSFKESGLI